MNRRDRVKRYLAMLLAFAMIFQQAGITTIADETEAVVAQQSEAAETKVQASAPETSAPETKAPETQAPETQAPETKAPETSAPETKAPETQASEKNETTVTETQAPETGAASEPETKLTETETLVTEAPETQLTETSQTETAATEGETEAKETETETETESETETEAPKTHFTYEDGRVQITADASEAAKLPQDAVLKADYLEPGSDAYNAAVAKIRAAYGLGEDVEVECAPYDIYFVSQGNRIEPEDGTVKVTIQFVKPVLGEAEGDLIDKGIAHIKDNGSVEDLNGSVNTNAQGAVSSVGFITDSFSVFAPFTVSQVTAQAATSSNLNQFATNVEFDNNLYDVDGALVLHPNSEYSFRMEFAESIDKGLFEKEGELTYTFPNQLTPAGAGGTFDMYITAGTTQYTLSGNTYTIEGNKIKVRFNKDGGAAYEALKAASNAKFWLSLRAKVNADASGDKIKFGDSVEKTVKFDNTAAVSVEKDGSYDKTSGQMNYTIKVKSTGTSTNVKVTDVITGTLLTYDKNVTATSNQKGALTIDPNTTAKGNGFEYTIPSMSDGEEVTFSYSASVDYSKLSGDKFTADETKNTVTAKGDNTDEDRKEHNFNNTTAYDAGFTKSGTKGEITNGWQTSNWTITVNADAKTDVGGGLVTDKIQENKKVPTKYSGTGITVKKYTADGNLVEEKPISWDQLKSHSETTWSYELPPKDGTPYKYVISYTTTSDISKTTENTSIINHAEFGGNETGGNVGVEGQNEFGVTKTHAAPSKDGVNWTVNVTIPNCGFNESFTITDALPSTWNNGVQCRDKYKDGSLKILMQGTEIGSDCYTVAAVTGSSQIQVVFKQEKLAELFPPTTGTERVLTMTYTTIPDSNWPEGENHNNTVTASGDGTNKTANDSYKLSEYKIEKKSDGNAGDAEGGLPTFKFSIYLQGVDKDTITVSDTFRTDLFVIDDGIYSWGMQSHHQVNIGAGSTKDEAGNGANGSSNGGTISYVPTSTGATFTVNVKKSGDAYYNWYCIRYCLKVKDAAALKKLQQMAANNTDHTVKIGNTAEWEGKSTGEVTVDYKVNPLTKTETGSPNKLNHYTSTFTVVVNPDKLQLNRGNDLTVTDTFSDAMELVTDSVKITLEPAGASSWDFGADKKSLTIKIPDGCKAVITYDAQITGKGHVTYKNNVTVTGNYSASTDDKSIDISTDGEGSAEHFQYKVIKRDADNKQKLLQGAIFQLFELKDGSETAVKNNKTGGDVTFTTDAKGEFMMAGAYRADGWELTKGHTYVLKEIQAPEGYKKAEPLTFTVGSITADGAHGNGYTFDIYDKEGKEIDISVVKTWNDANNQDGKRPESVMVQLYANGHTQSDPVELNADNKWSYKWEKLPDKENDELIAYTVRELQKNEDGSMTPVDDGAEITYLVNDENVTYKVGYSNTDNAWTISNTHTPETIDIEGRKTWDDADNQDGKRPSSITIHLYADGRELTDKVQTVTAADNWSWKFTDLPKYAEGKEIVYTIAEDAVENYTTVVDGYNVTNRHIPATINISGGKHWDDNNNQDGKRPSSIKIRLYADDTELTDKVQTVTAADNWEWTFTNLPKYANGGVRI
ncbi:MAG: Cna B-type domain-containing protein [Lachnospiraceae bacterium]